MYISCGWDHQWDEAQYWWNSAVDWPEWPRTCGQSVDAAAWRAGGPPHESAVQPTKISNKFTFCSRRSGTLLPLCSKSPELCSTMPCCARARLFTLIDTKNGRCAPQSPAVVPRPSLCNCLSVRFTILCIKKNYVKSQFGKNPRTKLPTVVCF